MKKTYSSYALSAILLFLCFFKTIQSSAANTTNFYSGTEVSNWDLVDYNPNFFDADKFTQNFQLMPENSWTKSTGSHYDEELCGITNPTKFTTDDGAKEFTPKDGVLYKFLANKRNKKITFSIWDNDKKNDGTLNIAVLENGSWTSKTAVSTSGKKNCTSYTIELGDFVDAVMLYMEKKTEDIYLGQVNITTDNNSALPITIYDISVITNTKTISWKVGVETGVNKYIIQGSNDSKIWKDVTTVAANGEEEYTTLLINTGVKAEFAFWLALIMIPFALIKKKSSGIVAILSFFLLIGGFISCSKDKDMSSANTNNLYKYYRIESMNDNKIVEISKTISVR